MKIALTVRDGGTRLGAVKDGRIVDLAMLAAANDAYIAGADDLAGFLRAGRAAWDAAAQLLRTPEAADERFSVPVAAADIRPPVVPSAKILCHVVNYAEHGAEAKIDPPERPFFFLKPTSSVTGPYDQIIAHRASTQLDYEVELAAVIGRPGRDIPAGKAYEHIAGYLVINDVSYRDLQFNRGAPELTRRYGQNWTQGKGLDRSCPIGPWITLVDEVQVPYPLWIRSWVDGRLRQDAKTSDQIFQLPTLIEAISVGLTLHPGDVIATGTPPGSAIADGSYLHAGQTVRCEVDGLGALVNEVKADDRNPYGAPAAD